MHKVAFLAAFGSFISASSAQSTAEVVSLAWPMSARARVSYHSEDSCGVSFADGSSETTLVLSVTSSGHAQLVVDAQMQENFGPNPLRMDPTPPTHTQYLYRTVFDGIAVAQQDQVDLHFSSATEASVVSRGYGTAPLPPATIRAISFRVRCRVVTEPVFGSGPDTAETSRPLSVLRCAQANPEDRLHDSLQYTHTLPVALARVAIVNELHAENATPSSLLRL